MDLLFTLIVVFYICAVTSGALNSPTFTRVLTVVCFILAAIWIVALALQRLHLLPV